MSQGLFVEDEKDADEAGKSDGEYEGAPAAAVRAVDRKTKQQRRKEKEKEEEVTKVLIDDWKWITPSLNFFFSCCMPQRHPTPTLQFLIFRAKMGGRQSG